MSWTALEVSFTEGDYRANEKDGSMPVKVIKNALIATAIELAVIPLTVQQSTAIIPSSLRDGIPIDNPYSPPFAGNAKWLTTNKFSNITIKFVKDVADFNNTAITIMFDPDEGQGHNEQSIPIPIFDDRVNEAHEQVFVVQLRVVGGANVNSITIIRRVSLCRIIDDDGKKTYNY